MSENSFLAVIEESIHKHGELPALTDYKGKTFYYKDFAEEIDKLHVIFNLAGIKKGDKIALCGRNSSRWAISFFAVLSYGGVVVSILHEFDKASIEHILNHSDSVMFFTDQAIWNNLKKENTPQLKTVLSLDNFDVLYTSQSKVRDLKENFQDSYNANKTNRFDYKQLTFRRDKPEELAVINYTSGTTSSPKGVMLPYRSLWSNTRFANDNLDFINAGDSIVCILPMAHAYGLTFEVLNSISMGMHIHFLNKVPSPKIIIEAFAEAKPKLVLAVPLILEKIIIKNVFTKISKEPIRTLVKIPGFNQIIHRKIRNKLIQIFGGELVEVVIGGAALNQEVEKFLKKIEFPYTVGYGMTECGPLISYSFWKDFKQKSVGRRVDRMEVKIDSDDQKRTVGEILVKGDNLMLGYYKNPEATKEIFTKDGWMKTGDLGIIDDDNSIYIKGRNKNMILGASGQNIFPEEIEDKINNYTFVSESLVIDENGKLVALIYPDSEVMTSLEVNKDGYTSFFNEVIKDLNNKLPSYSKISTFRIQEEEFEKTPKRSIKRFKYQK